MPKHLTRTGAGPRTERLPPIQALRRERRSLTQRRFKRQFGPMMVASSSCRLTDALASLFPVVTSRGRLSILEVRSDGEVLRALARLEALDGDQVTSSMEQEVSLGAASGDDLAATAARVRERPPLAAGRCRGETLAAAGSRARAGPRAGLRGTIRCNGRVAGRGSHAVLSRCDRRDVGW